MRRCGEYLERFGPPEALLRILGDASSNALARNRIRHENDAPVVPGNKYAAVSHIGNVEFDLGADKPRRLNHVRTAALGSRTHVFEHPTLPLTLSQ